MTATLPPRTATFAARPCLCCKGHTPVVLEVELHHILPQTFQRALWGGLRDRETVPLCRDGHRSLHIVLSAVLRGETPPRINPYLLRLVREGLRRITTAYAAEGKPLPTDGRGE